MTDDARWLRGLCDLAQAWVERNGGLKGFKEANGGRSSLPIHTNAYVDLIFAYSLAQLGGGDASRELLQRAAGLLADKGEPHRILLHSFDYRIRQALAGRPHGGPLPPELLQRLQEMGRSEPRELNRLHLYVIDRMRSMSRVLEPEIKVDPYRRWVSHRTALEQSAAVLSDVIDGEEACHGFEKLMQEAEGGGYDRRVQADILSEALNQSPRMHPAFAQRMLGLAPALFDALPETEGWEGLARRSELLERGLFTATRLGLVKQVPELLGRFQRLLDSSGLHSSSVLARWGGGVVRALRRTGARPELEAFLLHVEGTTPPVEDGKADDGALLALRGALHITAGWCALGRTDKAEPTLRVARSWVLRKEREKGRLAPLICTYADAAAWLPADSARARLEELFNDLQGFNDTHTTQYCFSRCQLEVIEAAALSVVDAACPPPILR
jgi:hypothetical protein